MDDMKAFLSRRAELIATAEPGSGAARQLCELTDEAVRALARTASVPPPGRWAIIALGGWGAGALLPKSDLDILVLSDASPAELKPFVEAVLYPLWDAGLKVGHQVRSGKGQLRAMRDDLATCTAALTGRPLIGDDRWATRRVGGMGSRCAQARQAVGRRADASRTSGLALPARARPQVRCRRTPGLRRAGVACGDPRRPAAHPALDADRRRPPHPRRARRDRSRRRDGRRCALVPAARRTRRPAGPRGSGGHGGRPAFGSEGPRHHGIDPRPRS